MDLLLAGGAVVLSLSILYGSWTIKLLSLLTAYFAWTQLKRPAGIPPGPRGVPILGYLPFILEHRGVLFQQIARKYGQIFSLYVFKSLTVVLNDYYHIRKAFIDRGEIFSGRPSPMKKSRDGSESKLIISRYGEFWREHRRFALATLRNFGVGKSSIEPALQNEIDYFLEAINDKQGKQFDIADLLGMSVLNNICILEFGKRFEYHDENFLFLKHAVDVAVEKLTPPTSLIGLFRFIKSKIPFLKKENDAGSLYMKVQGFCKQQAEEHLKTYQPGSTRDYIDAYITEKAERERTNNNAEMFDYDALHQNLNLLFFAGGETTTTTLKWGTLYMLMHPDVQRKVQQEIDDVIGCERLPSMSDMLQMPYTQATLQEISRRATIVQTAFPHSTTEAIDFCGFHLPEDTVIMPNLWGVHHDEKLFPDPFSFRPERFINERGQFVKHEAVIPFSLGKRFCLGEPLARMELFLYFTSMLQKFTFVNPEDQVLTDDPRLLAIRREDKGR
jgi:cytochrome P450